VTSRTNRIQPLVLIVDDDAVIRLTIRKTLRKSGFTTVEAGDGTEGLALFEEMGPDLVMLDVMMPGPDGFSVCRSIRALPSGAVTPVVFMTGLDDTRSINMAFEIGATDFITKPINVRTLPHHLRYLLRAGETLRQLQASEANNSALLDAIPDTMLQVDAGGLILDYKEAKSGPAIHIFRECTGGRLSEFLPGEVTERFRIATEIALRSEVIEVFEFQVSTGDLTADFEVRIVASGGGKAVAIVRDITEQKAYEKNRILAYYDSLTELPNRFFFRELLHRALRQSDRSGKLTAVLFLDLDNFKPVNDTMGHAAGDHLLQQVAERLATGVRGSDWVARQSFDQLPHMVSRFGGDEFTLLLTDLATRDEAGLVAGRLLDALSGKFIIGEHEVFVSASIGIALYPVDTTDAELLLACADRAMYAAKDNGKRNFQFYSSDLNERSHIRKEQL
jgi:diguanylate cyclase (GGDEF)-like protein